ncbi:hypothetical protein DRN73_03990 [Candidatus Pacearchaeota archaeon]|nr:MAG: hypothetical protein DRN73_03990 [Candidatus Pacearchaeota archaeon]
MEKIAEAQETPSLKWGAQEISTDTKKEKQNYELLEEKTTKDYQTAQERNNPIPPPILPKGEIDMQSIGRSQVQIGREFHLQEPPELKARGSAENYELINPGSIDIQKAGKEREKIGREYHPQRRQIR